MGGPNPKYQAYHGLWAVKFSFDGEVGVDCVEKVFPIESSRSYWACDMDRMTDIHSSEDSARASEKRVMDAHRAAWAKKEADANAEIDRAEAWLRDRCAGYAWFSEQTDEEIRSVAEEVSQWSSTDGVTEFELKVIFLSEEE